MCSLNKATHKGQFAGGIAKTLASAHVNLKFLISFWWVIMHTLLPKEAKIALKVGGLLISDHQIKTTISERSKL
jgi:hypothetical protein